MTDNKDIRNTHQTDPFLSQNVWLKRLGLILLLVGLGIVSKSSMIVITTIVIILGVVTYFIKQIKDFFKSLWNS